jgi:hypothetical protein
MVASRDGDLDPYGLAAHAAPTSGYLMGTGRSAPTIPAYALPIYMPKRVNQLAARNLCAKANTYVPPGWIDE